MIDRILSLMQRDGISAASLTSAIGLPRNSIAEWKTGKCKPGTDATVKIARYFGVSTDWLLTGNIPQEPWLDGEIYVGKRIYELMNEHIVSDLEIAEHLGVDASTLVGWLSNQSDIPSQIAAKIARYFGVSTDWIIAGIEPPLVIPEALQGVSVAFHRGEFEDLTQDEVDKLAEFAQFIKMQRNSTGASGGGK